MVCVFTPHGTSSLPTQKMLGGGRQRSRGAEESSNTKFFPLCPSAPGANHHAKFPWRTTRIALTLKVVYVTTLTANCKQCSGSISNSQMRLAVSRAGYPLSLHSQESVVQPTHALKDLMRCSSRGQ